MSELHIRTSQGEYAVHIGQGLADQMPAHHFELVDAAVGSRLPWSGTPRLALDASESNKSLSTCESVLQAMREAGCTREAVLLACGGGVVQDVATLSASLYMRGVAWIYAPTTFMAMADSCIGGKSSINVGAMKNLVGNIYPPSAVIIDLEFTRTLTPAALASGLAEAVKICFARSSAAFDRFLELRSHVSTMDSDAGADLVEHVLRSKQWFIETDEFDRGVRRLLNFGHTFGHAIESATAFRVPHGVAVGLGMLAALEHPRSAPGSSQAALAAEAAAILKPVATDVRAAWDSFDPQAFLRAFDADKKHSAEAYRLVLPGRDGLQEVPVARSDEARSAALDCVAAAFAKASA